MMNKTKHSFLLILGALFAFSIQCKSAANLRATDTLDKADGVLIFSMRYFKVQNATKIEEPLGSFYREGMRARSGNSTYFVYDGTTLFLSDGSERRANISHPFLLKFAAGDIVIQSIRSTGRYPVSGGTMNLTKLAPVGVRMKVRPQAITYGGEITITEDYATKPTTFRCEIASGMSTDQIRDALSGFPNTSGFEIREELGTCPN